MDTLNQSVSEVLSENLQKVVDYWYNENSGIDRHSTTTKDVGLISLLKESIEKGDEYSEYPIVKFMWEKLPESDMKVLKNLVKRERAESREADDEDVRMETMEFSEMSVEQFEQLEKRFCMEPYPTREERKEIAQMVGMSLEKTTKWFKGRRYEEGVQREAAGQESLKEELQRKAVRADANGNSLPTLENSPQEQETARELRDTRRELREARRELECYRQIYDNKEAELQEKTLKIKELRSRCKNMNELIEDLNYENGQLKRCLNGANGYEASERMMELEAQVEELSEKRRVKNHQLTRLQKELTEHKQMLEGQRNRLEAEISRLQRKVEEEKEAVPEKAELDGLRVALSGAKYEIKKLEYNLKIEQGKVEALKIPLGSKAEEKLITQQRYIDGTLIPKIHFLEAELKEYNKTLKKVNLMRYEERQEADLMKIQNKWMQNTVFRQKAELEKQKGAEPENQELHEITRLKMTYYDRDVEETNVEFIKKLILENLELTERLALWEQ
ncbi:hypothetical protein CRE_13105 [Caenorhabditis remanei]|uniref:Homeobox domain-containing protein n=1 Tax=Caenorhabditis remanei TaxID=31234 RepID=E3NEV8_CAERE|nr:hypothetical protein CRE_13105 [Caenorhabditis remanei]